MRGWKEFLGVDPDAAAYLIPEQFANQPLSPYSDQYVLGQIAVEMLTGRQPPPTHIVSPSDLADKNAFFANPLCAITEPWIRYHQGLAEVLTRLLHADPQRRFPSMDEAVKQLWDVEDEVVAYARFAYKAACDQPGFFDAFYSAFFAACPGARDEFVRAHGEQHAERMATQAQVLKFALASTLASPSTLKKKLAQFSAKHQTVPPEYFTAFAETFVATLKAQFADLPEFVLDASRTVLTRAATHMAADGGTGVVDQRPLGAA